MKNKIFIPAVTVVALCVGLHSASASLIGMPLNLKAAIEPRDVDGQGCHFYTDDVFAGPLLIKAC
jgi:hypothetical protein